VAKSHQLKTKNSKLKIASRDRLTKAKRSWNMGRIGGKNTRPEMIVRSLLHDRKLPGCPDIVLKKYKTVIFVHGCFWHRHKGSKRFCLVLNNKQNENL